uniref:TNF receptor-associated factor 6 n=1 Tax=Rhipicephalus zambeziensis TaxID=60191 RepID=A0A224Z1G9_9ACAR
MALCTQRYTLVGFSKEVDRRPLNFVRPIPANRICRACGVVPRVAALLPCLHVVCKTCYDQCRLNDGNSCPLDGSLCSDEDVDWRDFPADTLLRQQVKCWNEDNGCEVVTCAFKLHEHFLEDCDYHTTSCLKCSAAILCKDVCAHLRSDCTARTLPRMHGAPRTSPSDPEAIVQALNASLDARIGEMTSRLGQVMSESSAQSDRLNELSHCMNTIKEALLQPRASGACTEQSGVPEAAFGVAPVGAVERILITHGDRLTEISRSVSSLGNTLNQAMEDAKRTSIEKLEQNASDLRMLHADVSEHMTASTDVLEEITQSLSEFKAILKKELKPAAVLSPETTAASPRVSVEQIERRGEVSQNTNDAESCRIVLKGIAPIKEYVNLDGLYDYIGEKIYLSGYHILAGLKLVKDDEGVGLHARIKILKGVNDDFLEWPFYRNIKLTAVHPSSSQERHCVSYAFRSLTHFGKPGLVGNKALYFPEGSLRLEDLEREGYVDNDKLVITWELVPLPVSQ